jgi:hypothetical protein
MVLSAALLSACGAFEVGVETTPGQTLSPGPAASPTPAPTTPAVFTPTFAAPTLPAPTSTAIPTLQPPTQTPPPTATHVLPTDTPLPAATATPQGSTTVSIVLISLNDGGKTGTAVGCGDSAVPVTVEIPATQGVLKAAFDALLANKSQYYGQSGLYNALYQSVLKLDSAKIEDGLATLQISGKLSLGGECDNPRVKAQLEGTAKQFSTVKDTAIFINGKPMADALSLK